MSFQPSLIAPCGMNCALCLGYQRERNRCDGCRERNAGQPSARSRCTIANCEHLRTSQSGFCYDCKRYPCRRLRQLDRRYRTRYGMSMLANLEHIRDNGLDAFVVTENERWRCSTCGSLICIHRPACIQCGAPRQDIPA